MLEICIGVTVISAILALAHIDYETYNAGGQYLTYFLTPFQA